MRKKILIILALVLGLSLFAAGAMAKVSPISTDTAIWELSKGAILNPGEVTEMEEGVFIENITLEAKAKTKNGKLLPEGTFLLTFSAFSPFEDMGEQKAGFWYVIGEWTITKKNADPELLKFKHNPEVLKGKVMAELDSNPAEFQKSFSGLAWVPMSTATNQWGRGDGSLTLKANLEGDLYLDLSLWPEMMK